MFTSRQKQIVGTLLERSGFLPVSEIAAALNISGRTVLRELSALESDLRAFDARIERRSSQGVRLNCPTPALPRLTAAVSGRTKLMLCSKEERRRYIAATLLMSGEPVKSLAFTMALGVTDATVAADLDRLEQWFTQNRLTLTRKPGVGVYLAGDEWALRRGMLNLFLDACDYRAVMSILQSREALAEYAAQDVTDFLDTELVWRVKGALEAERGLRALLQADKDYYEFLIAAYYMVRRVSDGRPFAGSAERMAGWRRGAQFPLIEQLLQRLRAQTGALLPEGELDYLMLLLQVTHGRSAGDGLADAELEPLIREIIRIAESETGYILENNTTFYRGLREHLIPAINRLRLHLEVKNPLLASVKTHYPQLYKLASTCVAPIERAFSVTVPEPEIAYIAMYLGVALEDKSLRPGSPVRAVVCCPAGMVSAQFLATLLRREFPDITITDIVATTDINDRLLQSGAELVISTVPIKNLSAPNVTVSPFLLEDDRARLSTELKALARRPRWDAKLETGVRERLSNVKNIIDGILQVLNSFFLIDGLPFTRVQELIACAAERTGEGREQQLLIAQALTEREKYGSTVDFSSGCMLLHCRTEGVQELKFGLLRVDSPELVSCEGHTLSARLILVMLAPMRCPSEYISVMGAISQGVINEPWLVDAFQTGDRQTCYAALERLMSAFQGEYFMITGKEQQ